MTLPGILWFVGMALVFIGEQIVGTGIARWAVDGVGLVVVLGSIALRFRGLSAEDASVRDGALRSMIVASVATASLLFYALGTDDFVDMMGFGDEARVRWQGSFGVLTPIVLVLGAVPMAFLDLVVSGNPKVLPRDAANKALFSGLLVGVAISFVFPVNFLADHYNVELDTAYFRTARPGDATKNLVGSLTKPVKVSLFFPPGNDVLEEMRPYFDEIVDASDGMVQVETHDQALAIALAEELKLQENGWIVIQEEGEPVKFKMRLELDRAKRDLKKLDSLFQKNLLKASRGQRVAYMVKGHGEASHRTQDNDWRKLSQLRKDLQSQSYKLEDLGLVEGLNDAVPDDADLVILAAPMDPLLPEEIAALEAYYDAGGQLLVLTDAASDPLTDLLGHLGLAVEEGPVTDPKRRLRGLPGHFILTDRYGTHGSVSTLSKARRPMLLPQPVGLAESGQAAGKRTVLLRSYGTAFADKDRNGEQDEGEIAKVHNLAYAVEAGDGEDAGRAIVIGSVAFVSDNAYTALGWRVNPYMVIDSVRWLAGEESLAGETESEEDVKIDHSPEGQRWWFWGTILAVPVLVLIGGIGWVSGRRRMR